MLLALTLPKELAYDMVSLNLDQQTQNIEATRTLPAERCTAGRGQALLLYYCSCDYVYAVQPKLACRLKSTS